MYHAYVRRRVRRQFELLSAGDFEPILASLAPHFEHFFLGDHPLGGTRHSIDAMRRWFERLFILNTGLHFTVKTVYVAGGPWNTTVVTEWSDAAELADKGPYLNHGVHVIRIRWGKVVSIHAYLDTERWASACRRMAANGVREAAALPIED